MQAQTLPYYFVASQRNRQIWRTISRAQGGIADRVVSFFHSGGEELVFKYKHYYSVNLELRDARKSSEERRFNPHF
ncbi:MAG: hypothetical protein QNJ41_28140 [Xenococcaceae cyanobacterium MO_188.B32]|nr:hypothetical protein [Xenococcaceae cyanobacterium MO_188.B32]